MNFLKSVADKAKSAVDSLESPTKSVTGSRQNGSESGASYDGDISGQEGFLCPMCMSRFAGPDQLQQHFEDKHSGDDNQQDNQSTASGEVFSSTGNGHRDEEKTLLLNQIKALEESKSLMSMEVNNLRSKLEDATNKQMDEMMLEKANQLAAENVSLKASLDEMSSINHAIEERCKVLEVEKEHRNSTDDASVLKQELVSVQRAMDESLQEKEVQLHSLIDENIRLKDAIESKEQEVFQKNNNSLEEHKYLQVKLVESNQSIKSLQGQLQLKDEKIRDLESNCDKQKDNQKELQQKCDNLDLQLNQQNDTVNQLKNELESAKHLVASEKNVAKDLESSIKNLKKEKNEVANNLESTEDRLAKQVDSNVKLEKDKGDLQENVKRLTGEREELLKQIEEGEGSNMAIQQLTQENSNLQAKLSELNTSQNTKTTEHNTEIANMSNQISTLKDQCNNYKLDIEKTIKELDNINKEKAEVNLTLTKLNDDLQIKVKEIHDLNKKLETTNTDNTELASEIAVLKETIANVKKDLVQEKAVRDENINIVDNLNKEKNALKSTVSNLEESIKEKDDENDNLKNMMEEFKTKDKEGLARISSLEQDLKNSQNEITEKESSIKMLKEAKQYLEQTNHKLEQEKLSLEARREELESQLEQARDKIDQLMADGEHEKARVQELESVINKTEKKVQEMRTAIDQAMGKERSLLSDLEEKSKTISVIEMEKSTIASSLESKQSTLEMLRKEKEDAENKLESEKQERIELEEQICNLQSKWEVERSKQEEKLEELQTARELLINQVVELKESLNKDKTSYETKLGTLQDKLDQQEKEFEATKAMLQEVQLEHVNFKEKCSKLEKDLNDELDTSRARIDTLEDTVKEAEKESNKQQSLLSTAVVERDAAHSKMLELQAAVGAATEERRGLLERCLAAEAETERSRNLTVELRRKMEDSQAALHELGRENQSLQMEVSRQSGRKWKDDSDATNCHSCSGLFSLTNRKHHCRNCGNIFCNLCSSKQTTMDGFKKPQRVCEVCFVEIGNK